jgi:3-deoxy-D-manno-octulosonate 8-phosphate phosphatase (KDO 8-P phosphatase)
MNKYEKFAQIETLIFDVDGVFTDNSLLITENGDFLRVMSARDGLGVRLAREAGLRLAIITGGNSLAVQNRLNSLGVQDIFLKIDKKIDTFQQYIAENNLDPSKILYMGDDLLDIEVLQSVYLPCCPRDAAPEVLEVAEYISPVNGGAGCVRDVIEKVLQSQQKWPF